VLARILSNLPNKRDARSLDLVVGGLATTYWLLQVDYCNSLLAACTQQQTDKVQRVLNCAVRVILGGSKYDHVTPLIRDDLHWLRVAERIAFKLCLFV